MATILTLAELRTHVETDLTDAALTRLLEEADALVVRQYGAHTGNDTIRVIGGGAWVWLTRPASAIVTVVETDSAGDETTLASDDFRLWDARRLQRLDTGTNQRGSWDSEVAITFTPIVETEIRKRVVVDLVKLSLVYEGLQSKSAGDFSARLPDYEIERTRLLDRLNDATQGLQ